MPEILHQYPTEKAKFQGIGGAVLTTDTTLTADLVDCAGDGLVVGADGVTLDLNAHVVGGDSVEDPSDTGIRVCGYDGVRVTHGTVQGFYRGVVFDASTSGTGVWATSAVPASGSSEPPTRPSPTTT